MNINAPDIVRLNMKSITNGRSMHTSCILIIFNLIVFYGKEIEVKCSSGHLLALATSASETEDSSGKNDTLAIEVPVNTTDSIIEDLLRTGRNDTLAIELPAWWSSGSDSDDLFGTDDNDTLAIELPTTTEDMYPNGVVRQAATFGSNTPTPYTYRTRPKTTPGLPEPKGPFYNFVKGICDVLIEKFSNKQIKIYFPILARALRGLGSGFLMKRTISKFRRALKNLAEIRKADLKSKVKVFRAIITQRKWPHKNECFRAFNAMFSIYDDLKFDDYIYELRRYGSGQIHGIYSKSRYVFQKMFDSYHKQSEKAKDELQRSFKFAMIEFSEETRKILSQS